MLITVDVDVNIYIYILSWRHNCASKLWCTRLNIKPVVSVYVVMYHKAFWFKIPIIPVIKWICHACFDANHHWGI